MQLEWLDYTTHTTNKFEKATSRNPNSTHTWYGIIREHRGLFHSSFESSTIDNFRRKLRHAEGGQEDGQIVEDLVNLGEKELCLCNVVDRVDVILHQ